MLEEGMKAFALLGAEWVLWLLIALSIGCIAIAAERAFYLLRDGTHTGSLASAVNAYLRDGDLVAFGKKLKALGGFEARVLSAGVEMKEHGHESAEHAMRGTATAEKMRMDRGLSFLATVGANAPFIGLFGTVLGIIKAFHDLAESAGGGGGNEAVMAGISEALIATAVGLLVAIPAVVLYNSFSRWVKSRVSRVDSLADLVIARMRGGDPADHLAAK